MGYKRPLQPRAILTENRLLDALIKLLKVKPLSGLTIEEVAHTANLTKGAFLKRFGSKKQALFLLWDRYIDDSVALKNHLAANLVNYKTAVDACAYISSEIEKMQTANFSINRAMYEEYAEELMIHSGTQRIFLECVDLMQSVRRRFAYEDTPRGERDFAAAQLLISLNYHYVLKAMPGLPADAQNRHRLIGRLVVEALKH